MASEFDYREMAHECLKEAAATTDANRKKSLEEIARLYMETALNIEGVGIQDNEPAVKKTA
jgi:hypothetical protein